MEHKEGETWRTTFIPLLGTTVRVWPNFLAVNQRAGWESPDLTLKATVAYRWPEGFWRFVTCERIDYRSGSRAAASQLGAAATAMAREGTRLVAVPTSGGYWACASGGLYQLYAQPDEELLAAMRAVDRLEANPIIR